MENTKPIMEIDSKEEAVDDGNSTSKDEGKKMQLHLCDCCKTIDYNKTTLAERLCIKCELKLCPPCEKTHVEEGEHFVLALNDQKEVRKLEKSDFCYEHDEELAELYCTCCRKVICSECKKESHSSHNCSRVTDVAELVSKQTEAEYENLSDIQRHLEKERQKLIDEKIQVIRKTKEMESEIQKRCDDIVAFVYDETKSLLNEVDVFRKERLEEIELERKQMEEHAFAFQKFKEYCDQMKSNRYPRRTCEAEGVLRNIMDELKDRLEGRWKSRLFSVQISIQKTDIEEIKTSLSAAVGKVTVSCPYMIAESCEVKLDEKEVFGMTKLHDKLYVLSNSISIRRLRHPFSSLGEIDAPGTKSLRDIASCSKTSCLYIYDSGEYCVWKIAIPSNQLSRWLNKIYSPCSLSVTSNANLLILRNNKATCPGVQTVPCNEVLVYNEHAILLRRFRLPSDNLWLRRLYETPSGNYIGQGASCVVTLKRNGSIISQFQPSQFPNCQGNIQCACLSTYLLFLYCGSTHEKQIQTISGFGFGNSAQQSVFGVPLSKKGQTVKKSLVHRGSISSLNLDLTDHRDLVTKPQGWLTPVTSLYLKETKQVLVLEEIVSGDDKTWNLRAYDVLPACALG